MAIIEVFKLDIDTDAVTAAASNFKSQADSIKADIDRLKKAGDTSSETYIRLKGELDSVNAEYRVAQREVSKLTSLEGKEIRTIQEARNALSVVSSQWAKQADLYGENSDEVKELAELKLQLTERLKEEEAATGDTSRNVGNYTDSIVDALGQTSIFSKEIATAKQVAAAFGPILGAVGTEALAAGKQMIFAARGTEGLSKSQKLAAISTNILSGALKLFRVALISTGIGAIVVLIASLVAYFGSTQKGIDLVNKALVPLKVVFETLFGVLQEVGEAIASLFTADGIKSFGKAIKDFVLSRIDLMKRGFSAVGKILTGDFKAGFQDLKDIGTELVDEMTAGFEKLKDLSGELAERMREAFERGQRIAELQILIEEAERDIIVASAQRELQIKRQEIIQKDITKTFAERQKAVEESLRLGREELDQQNAILDLQIEQLQLKQASNDTSRDDEKELQELLAQRIKNQGRLDEVILRNLEVQNGLRREAAAIAQKAQDDAIKKSKAELDLFIQQNTTRSQTLAQELELAEQIRDKRLAILQQEVDARKKTVEEAAAIEFKIKQEFLDQQVELVIANADRELQVLKDASITRLQDNQFLTESLVQQEIERLQKVRDAEAEFAKLRLEQGVLNQTEYNDAIKALDLELFESQEEVRLEREEAVEAARLIDLENQRAIAEENFQFDLEQQLFFLDQQKQQELKAAEETGANVALIEDKYAAFRKEIENSVQSARVDAASATFGNLAAIAGKESDAGKAFAVAQTTIDTYQSAVAAYKSLAGIPVVGPALGAIAAAAAVAGGLANVSKIVSTPKPTIPKAEKGALFKIGGRRHSQGGTKFRGDDGTQFEAERGELIGVMNRNAARAFMSFNNSFPAGGPRRGGYFQTGGTFDPFSAGSTQIPVGDPIDLDKLGEIVIEGVSALPAPQVEVVEISDGLTNQAEIVDGANL